MNIPFKVPEPRHIPRVPRNNTLAIGNTAVQTISEVKIPKQTDFRISCVAHAWLDDYRRTVAYTTTGVQNGTILTRYTKVSDYLMSHPVLSNDEKMLLFHLMREANDVSLDSGDDVEVEIFQQELLLVMGVSKNTLTKATQNLQKFGLLKVEDRNRKGQSTESLKKSYKILTGPWPLLGDLPEIVESAETMKMTMHTWRSAFTDRSVMDGWRRIALSKEVDSTNVIEHLVRYLKDKKTFFSVKISGQIEEYVAHIRQVALGSNSEPNQAIGSKFEPNTPSREWVNHRAIGSKFEPNRSMSTYGKPAPQGDSSRVLTDRSTALRPDLYNLSIYRSSYMYRNSSIKRAGSPLPELSTGADMTTDRVLDVLNAQAGRTPKNKRSSAEEVVKAYTTAVRKKDPEYVLAYSAKTILGIVNNVLKSNKVEDVCRAVSWLVQHWEGYKPAGWDGDDSIPEIKTILSGHFLTKGMNDSRKGIKPVKKQKWNEITNQQLKAAQEADPTDSLEEDFLRRHEALRAKKGMK